jgi:hypothetical protein
MSLTLNSKKNFHDDEKFYSSKDFLPGTYTRVIPNTKNNKKPIVENSEFTDKKEILLVQEKILSATLLTKKYYTTSSFKKFNKQLHSKNLSTCNISSSQTQSVTQDNHDYGRATHFISKSRRNKLSSNYLEKNLSNANTGTKSDVVCANRLSVIYKPIKKRKNVKNPLTHVPYNENNSYDFSDYIDFELKPSSENIENFFKTNESVQHNCDKNVHNSNKYLHDTEENKKVEIQRTDYILPEQGKESGTVACGCDNIRLVYMNHEKGAENIEKPVIRNKLKNEKMNPLQTMPNKLNMGYVKEVLDNYEEKKNLDEIFAYRNSGNESTRNNKRNTVDKKENLLEAYDKLRKDDHKNLRRKYNYRVIISTQNWNQSLDEERDCCVANQRCLLF